MRHFTPSQLKQYLAEQAVQPLLLDVREPWEFNICQLNGSQLLPMHQIPQNIHQLNPQREIVVICHHGIRSRQVGLFLEQHGFKEIINLTGGLAGWAKDIDPTMSTY